MVKNLTTNTITISIFHQVLNLQEKLKLNQKKHFKKDKI